MKFEQAWQQTPDGKIVKRWYVWIYGVRRVTWAENERKARARRSGVTKVEPAPSMLDEKSEVK